jgi:hypothetical protein
MADAVEEFADFARRFREWVLTGTDSGPTAARRALELVSGLYLAALALPRAGEFADEPWTSPADLRHRPSPSFAARLPFQLYGEVFDPRKVPPEQPVVGDLADDLSDIFGDVDRGLVAFEAGRGQEAVWEWGFYLAHHWGEHATSAIRAIHCWLAREHTELLGG